MRRPLPAPVRRRAFPVVRFAIAAAGFLVLGVGWKVTSAEPGSASAAVMDASAIDPAPADYVPEDSSAPLPPPVDPLGQAPDEGPPVTGNTPGAPLLTPLRITSNFGLRRHPILGFTQMHQGVDLGAREGSPVVAAEDGVVTDARVAGGYGNLIRIRHAAGWATGYGHLSAFAPGIAQGVRVTRGELIGFVGHTGMATGPHLHFEVSYHDVRIDPMTTPFGGAAPATPVLETHAAYAGLRPALTTDMPAG
jgi:murein DD-endopeptidase MepM/ murein hydrolase activator NlpD